MVQIYKLNSRKIRNSYQNKSIASMADVLKEKLRIQTKAQIRSLSIPSHVTILIPGFKTTDFSFVLNFVFLFGRIVSAVNLYS